MNGEGLSVRALRRGAVERSQLVGFSAVEQ